MPPASRTTTSPAATATSATRSRARAPTRPASIATVRRRIRRWRSGHRAESFTDELTAEEPLEIQIDTRPIVVTMRTPGHDDELAAGFLISEGLIHQRSDIVKIQADPRNRTGNVVQVFLQPEVSIDFARLTRHVFASSSCGLCGKASIESVRRQFKPLHSRLTVSPRALLRAAARLQQAQAVFAQTGGLHAAAICDRRGTLVVLREDVGRHNAVDKVLGYGALQNLLPFDQHVLLVSGRASFEILQKALSGQIAIVAAVSAPSSLAVDFATEAGITLVGFLRPHRMNIYSHAKRIRD